MAQCRSGQCGRHKKTQVRSLGKEDSPGEGNGNPLQYSCLENPMDRGLAGYSQRDVQGSDMTEQLSIKCFNNLSS